MKKLPLLICFTLILKLSSAQDTSFYDYGWIEMMEEGQDYKTISETAFQFYQDTTKKNDPKYKYKHYVRWEGFWRNRTYSNAEDVADNRYGLFYHYTKAVNNLFNSTPSCIEHPSADWESWGFNTQPKYTDGSVGHQSGMGVMFTVKIDTADHSLQTIYAGSPIGGVWKTTDQGNNWYNISDTANSPGLNISDIDIDPQDNQHLLVGTGAQWSLNQPGIGVIESFDAGQSWHKTGIQYTPSSYYDEQVKEVHFHPTDTNKYFALVDETLLLSSNKGVDWNTNITPPANNLKLQRLQFHPLNPDTIYLSTVGFDSRLYRTFDGGLNWTDITNNFKSLTDTLILINIEVSKGEPDRLYVLQQYHQMSGTKINVLRSKDLGNNSTQLTVPNISNNLFQDKTKETFIVSPVDDKYVIAGGVRFYFSIDSGKTYTTVATNIHDDIRGGDFVDGLAAIATDGGISLSFNNGQSWIKRYNGLNVQQCVGHDVDKNYTYLISALQDVGYYRFDIATKTWNTIKRGEGGVSMISDINPNLGINSSYCGNSVCNKFIVSYSNSGYGATFGKNLPNHNQWYSPERRPFKQLHNENILTGMEDLYSTSSYGIGSWTRLTDFDGDSIKGDPINDYIIAIEASQIDTNLIVVAFGNEGWNVDEYFIDCASSTVGCPQKKVLVSHDKGATWDDKTVGANGLELPVRGNRISDLILDPADPAKMWVSIAGYTDGKKVYFSPDTGNNWYNISYNLINLPVNGIAIQPYSYDRLFAATDFGVYTKDASSNNWECYNTNLPPGMFDHLDVNNCGGALTASGHGRGIWKSPLPDIDVYGNQTWDGYRQLGGNAIIHTTLTITGTVELPSNKKITVMPGGKLILDGGTLTHSGCGDDLWQGVELLGDPNINQNGNPMGTYTHGYIKLTNGATIENAKVGILAGSLETGQDKAGGLIHMEDSSFISNCRIGIRVKPYINYNQSTYKNSFFHNDGLSTDPATGNALVTEAFVSLEGTSIVGHEFDSMEFKNFDTGFSSKTFDPINWQGIRIIGKKYGSTSEAFVQNSNFENLSYGIRGGNFSTGVGNNIENNTFTKLKRGIYILGGYSIDIKDNVFDIADIKGSDNYAIMLNGMTAFDIRRNTINGANNFIGGGAWYFYGIITENTGDGGGIIFDNQIGDGAELDRCIQAQGDNRDLILRCNNFFIGPYNLATGVSVLDMPGTVAQLSDQGHPNCFGGNLNEPNPDKAAAGNEWETLCAGGTLEDIQLSSGVSFAYYGHTRNEFQLFTTDPKCSPTSWYNNFYIDCGIDKQSESCNALYTPPSTGGGGEPGTGEPGLRLKSGANNLFIADFYKWYKKLVAEQDALMGRVNGTQTEAQWIKDIKSGNNPTQLEQSLSNASPLSDRVLNTLIETWAGQENALLKSILKENVPLSKQQLVLLHKKGLAAKWASTIYAASPQYNKRDSLVQIAREIRFAAKELQLAEWMGYRQLLDSTNLKAAYTLLDTSFFSSSLKLLAKDYAARGEYIKCKQLLTRLKTYSADGKLIENKAFVDKFEQLLPSYQNGKSAAPLKLNVQTLRNMALQKDDLGAEAEALLQSATGEFEHHPIMRLENIETPRSATTFSSQAMEQFVLYPNPNSGFATLAYELAGETAAIWQLFDVNGRKIMHLTLPVGTQQQQLDLSGLSNGVYHFAVSVAQERLQSGKMVITGK